MAEPARQPDESDPVTHPVRWLGKAWERIARAADVLTAKHHRKHNAVDVIRIGTMDFVDKVLDDPDS